MVWSTPLFLAYVDISQRLQAISWPLTVCALNEATMKYAYFVYLFLHLDLSGDDVEDGIHV